MELHGIDGIKVNLLGRLIKVIELFLDEVAVDPELANIDSLDIVQQMEEAIHHLATLDNRFRMRRYLKIQRKEG